MRVSRRRHYLMCRPTYFDVVYSINPWMDPAKPVDQALANAQWEDLRAVYLRLGHTVDVIEGIEGLPDMVFAANGATVIDGRALVARFRDSERTAEAPAYRDWLHAHGFPEPTTASLVNEGEGDYLLAGQWLLAGTGFRSDPRSHAEAHAVLATEADALAFGLNATSDGRNVVLPEAATGLARALRGRGFHPVGVDLSELLTSGGSVKCCTLELRGQNP